jgi:nitrous oxidase accessory protein NosD
VSSASRWIASGIAASSMALAAPAARATTDYCGVTIVDDVTLDQDLTCPAGGITVGADGIKINLQGHSISGPGSGTNAGITINNRADVTVFGGTIANFMTGVLVINATDVVIKDLALINHVDGVDVQPASSGITIKANTFLNNRTRGIMIRTGPTGIEVKDNILTGNRVGILLFGPTDATVKNNIITASTLAGMRVNFPATANLVLDNTITANPSGIEFLLAPDGSGAAGNEFKANRITANTCGIKGPGSANSFKDNQLSGNTSDICG